MGEPKGPRPRGPARKRFGQHFLHDPGVIARIVEAIDPDRERRLIEIGPGHGALTFPLLERAGRLEVVEIDRDLIPELRARSGPAPAELWPYNKHGSYRYFRVTDAGLIELTGPGEVARSG